MEKPIGYLNTLKKSIIGTSVEEVMVILVSNKIIMIISRKELVKDLAVFIWSSVYQQH